MEALLLWLDQHWFELVQTLGIIGSILMSSAAVRSENQAQKLGHYLTLVGHHRELWSEAHRRTDLVRIFQSDVDLIAEPVTIAEQEFLNLAIEHFTTGWLVAKNTRFLKLKVLAADAGTFFRNPLPLLAWNLTKHARDPRFIQFIEEAIAHEAWSNADSAAPDHTGAAIHYA